ncbi:MAG: NAD(P)/FAD-dependent oxidoreductase [Clostridiales bacterium]|nr:NAD(P)/FAD-dependent oxidoreductase [Clostridiales bacterium]
MKITVVGAGQGGLQAALLLANAGYDVTVYEKSPRSELGHDQLDAVEPGFFEQMSIPLPAGAKRAVTASFLAPYSDAVLTLNTPEEKENWSIERRIFSLEQVERCEKAGVKFFFETEVKGLVFKRDCVTGIQTDDGEILSDLVIDAGGVYSVCRESFHGRFGITEKPKEDEVFNIVHTYYEPAPGVNLPDTYNYYLKYNGSYGICWCGIEVDGSVSTLIGNIGELKNEEYERLFACLRKDNPIIGEKVLRGGRYTAIPVRYPAPIMVANGYASVGDSAFMTVPIMGNGIASSIRAGQFLAESVIENGDASISTLWKYEVKFFKKYGAVFCFLDILKRGLLETDDDTLKFLFESGIVTNEEIESVLHGRTPSVTLTELKQKVTNLMKIRKSVASVAAAAFKGVMAMTHALNIPQEYDSKSIFVWAYKLDSFFKK